MANDVELRKLVNVVGQLAVAMNNNTRAINHQTAVIKDQNGIMREYVALMLLEKARWDHAEGAQAPDLGGEASEDAGGGEAAGTRSFSPGSSCAELGAVHP